MRDVKIPPMLIQLIDSGISGIDKKIFENADKCPDCKGKLITHDFRRKKFATRIYRDKKIPVYVRVKRFRCKECGRLVYADEPFYPEIRVGAPVVDFCLANRERYSYAHISRILKHLHIYVSPSSVGNYASADLNMPPAVEMHGIFFPASLLNLANVGFPDNSGVRMTAIMQMISKRHF